MTYFDPQRYRWVRLEPFRTAGAVASECDKRRNPQDVADLQTGQVRRAGALVGLFDVEFDFLSFFEVWAAHVFHVEEDVFVSVLSIDETVAARVVEEINRSSRHCNWKQAVLRHNPFAIGTYTARDQRLRGLGANQRLDMAKSKTISFRVDEDAFEALRRIAEERDLSLSALFRDYVDSLVAHDGQVDLVPADARGGADEDAQFPPTEEVPTSFIREHERLELEADHLREQLDEHKEYLDYLQEQLEESEEEVIHLEELDSDRSFRLG